MAFLKRTGESLRGKTRDEICNNLRAIGVEAKVSERDRPEEKIGVGWPTEPLGLIDVTGGPIQWLNVTKLLTQYETDYGIDYGVPDSNLAGWPNVKLHSVHVRAFPVFGKVTDLGWAGEDNGRGVFERLTADRSLIEPLIPQIDDVSVKAHSKSGCWILRTTNARVSRELWDCYQRIAQHLLDASAAYAENSVEE